MIKDEDVEFSLLKEIHFSFAKANNIFPIKRENTSIVAAVSDEKGLFALIELAKRHNLKPEPVKLKKEAILDAINKYYGQVDFAQTAMNDISGEDLSSIATEFETPKDLLELTEEAPIIRLLNALLLQAVKERASDIHIEPYESELEIRMRVDGILDKVFAPPKIIQDALISRIKILATLDIAEKRLPQDGRIRLLIGGKDIDVRVSIIPTVHGERGVLRLLDRRGGLIGLSEIGMNNNNKKTFEELLMRPNGIILSTGPTGSGKTTTLYAALNKIYSEEKNIITIEDPVEYELKGIGQMHVNPKINFTFASGLRSILRQDPDIIMVGEIRDLKTAEIATQASLTGHLVLSTLHTNDAPSAITRLIDIGVEPFLVSSSLIGILAQRLVRKICPHCKEAYKPSSLELSYFNEKPEVLYRGKGCDRCRKTGYLGRTGIFELLIIDNEIRSMVTEKIDAQKIKTFAVSKGIKTLRMDGLNKVLEGTTTLEEVLRVTQKDYADISI